MKLSICLFIIKLGGINSKLFLTSVSKMIFIIDNIYWFFKILWLILRRQPLSSKMSHETVNMFIVNPGEINSKLFLTSVPKMIFIIDKIYCLFKNFPLKYDWYKDAGHYLVKCNNKATICLFMINPGDINSKLFWRMCPKWSF